MASVIHKRGGANIVANTFVELCGWDPELAIVFITLQTMGEMGSTSTPSQLEGKLVLKFITNDSA